MVFKNIISTTGSRIINAVFSFIILLLMTQFIGKEGLGTVSLLIVDITLIQLFIDLLGGSALVYFASRFSVFQMLFIAYVWNIFIVSLIGLFFGYLFHLFPDFQEMILPGGFGSWVLMMALFNGWMQIHYNLLIGLKKIKSYNQLFLLQISLFLLGFLLLIFVAKQISPLSYLQALLFSWIITALAGLIALRKNLKQFSLNSIFNNTGKIMMYGLATSAGNAVHIGNKRLSFYFVRILNGLAPLGILSAAVQLTEGLRIIAQSIALVQFSAISNSNDKEYAKNLTVKSMKFALTVTFLALLVLLALPTSFYGIIFSQSFIQIKGVIFSLSPAVLALAANAVFSHYFSGTGRPKTNLHANITGSVITILLAFLLIQPFGIIGAAWVASGSYATSAFYQYFVFRKQAQIHWKEWLIRSEDIKTFIVLSRKLFFPRKA